MGWFLFAIFCAIVWNNLYLQQVLKNQCVLSRNQSTIIEMLKIISKQNKED